MSLLESLRKKSPDAKNRYALGGAISITLVIALFWTTSLPARFSELSVEGSIGAENENELESFSEFFSETKNQLGAVVESVEKLEVAADDVVLQAENTKIEPEEAREKFFVPDAAIEPEITPEPRVILIGTSTGQKIE